MAAATRSPARADGDRLFGRGSADMKGGVAAMVVAACASPASRRARAGIELVLTAGEETGCAGAADRRATRACWAGWARWWSGEPTGLAPRLGHRGVIWIRLRFRGRTAHASMPHEGDNAVLKAARAAMLLSEYDFDGIAHPALGRPTLNVGRIEGGLNLNSVPDSADARHRHPHGARAEQRRVLAELARASARGRGRAPSWIARRCGAIPAATGWREVAERTGR